MECFDYPNCVREFVTAVQKGSRFSLANLTYPIWNPMLAIIAIFVFIIIIIVLSTYFLATDYLCEHFSLFALIFLPTLFFIQW